MMLISIICPFEVNEGTKKKAFLTCLVSKGFASSMKQTKQKTTSKKTFFFFFGQQSKVSKKKTKCLLCLCLSFKKSLRTTEVQHLLFFSETSNPEVVSCTNNKVFFSFLSSFTRKQSFQQTNCFFFV